MAMGTFGAFTQARLAIYAAQTGITVTGNNISNVNTEGYTRQRVNQTSLYVAGSDRYYAEGDIRTGQGALVKSISQIRNPYLDIRYREENAKVGFYDARLEGLNSIQRVLDEVGLGDASKGEDGFGILGLDFMKLSEALQNITDQTGQQEYDDAVRAVAEKVTDRLHTYAAQLEQVRDDTVTDFKQDIDQVNNILDAIRNMNEEIRKCEIYGDPALELRDARNVQLDKLSGLIDINVIYGEEQITAGLKVEKMMLYLGDSNPDKSVHTDESLLIDGVYSAHLILGKPAENPAYGVKIPDLGEVTTKEEAEEALEKLKAAKAEIEEKLGLAEAPEETPPEDVDEPPAEGVDTQAEENENEGGEVQEPTVDDLKAEIDTLLEELKGYTENPYLDESGSPTDDIRQAKIVTDDAENPNYDMMITELKNTNGDLNYVLRSFAAEKFTGTLPEKLSWKNNMAINELSGHDVEGYEDGDRVIDIYTRTPVLDANGKPTNDYTYTMQRHVQVVSKPVALDDNDLGGELQAERELLTEEGVFIDQKIIDGVDENAAIKRGIGYYQKALDLLANRFAKAMNEANQGFLMDDKTGEYITENPAGSGKSKALEINGKTLNKDWEKTDGALRTAILAAVKLDGKVTKEADLASVGLTWKQVADAYLKGQTWEMNATENGGMFVPENREEVLDSDGKQVAPGWKNDSRIAATGAIFVGTPLFSNANNSDDVTNITASNINISQTWSHTSSLVRSFSCVPGTIEPASGQSDNLLHLKYVVGDGTFDFTPNQLASSPNASGKPSFTGTFYQMWNDICGTLGQDQSEAGTMLDTYYQSALSIDTDRDSVSSVDFNDEAMNLMMYAKSYNAACRLMTTIDTVLDKLINNTGVTT